MTYIKRGGIDQKVREEIEKRRQLRNTLDIMSGASRSKGAMRADYKLCRENDKLYADYRRFTDKSARGKINKELEQVRREYAQKS